MRHMCNCVGKGQCLGVMCESLGQGEDYHTYPDHLHQPSEGPQRRPKPPQRAWPESGPRRKCQNGESPEADFKCASPKEWNRKIRERHMPVEGAPEDGERDAELAQVLQRVHQRLAARAQLLPLQPRQVEPDRHKPVAQNPESKCPQHQHLPNRFTLLTEFVTHSLI